MKTSLDTPVTAGHADDVAAELPDELRHAHRIIRNALTVMTPAGAQA